MTGLLPQGVQDAVRDQSLYAASESFGVVALVLLVLLLLESETLRAARSSPVRTAIVTAVALPLAVAVVLTAVLRLTALLP